MTGYPALLKYTPPGTRCFCLCCCLMVLMALLCTYGCYTTSLLALQLFAYQWLPSRCEIIDCQSSDPADTRNMDLLIVQELILTSCLCVLLLWYGCLQKHSIVIPGVCVRKRERESYRHVSILPECLCQVLNLKLLLAMRMTNTAVIAYQHVKTCVDSQLTKHYSTMITNCWCDLHWLKCSLKLFLQIEPGVRDGHFRISTLNKKKKLQPSNICICNCTLLDVYTDWSAYMWLFGTSFDLAFTRGHSRTILTSVASAFVIAGAKQ